MQVINWWWNALETPTMFSSVKVQVWNVPTPPKPSISARPVMTEMVVSKAATQNRLELCPAPDSARAHARVQERSWPAIKDSKSGQSARRSRKRHRKCSCLPNLCLAKTFASKCAIFNDFIRTVCAVPPAERRVDSGVWHWQKVCYDILDEKWFMATGAPCTSLASALRTSGIHSSCTQLKEFSSQCWWWPANLVCWCVVVIDTFPLWKSFCYDSCYQLRHLIGTN